MQKLFEVRPQRGGDEIGDVVPRHDPVTLRGEGGRLFVLRVYYSCGTINSCVTAADVGCLVYSKGNTAFGGSIRRSPFFSEKGYYDSTRAMTLPEVLRKCSQYVKTQIFTFSEEARGASMEFTMTQNSHRTSPFPKDLVYIQR